LGLHRYAVSTHPDEIVPEPPLKKFLDLPIGQEKLFEACHPDLFHTKMNVFFNFTTNLSDFTQHFSLTKERRATD